MDQRSRGFGRYWPDDLFVEGRSLATRGFDALALLAHDIFVALILIEGHIIDNT